jgi:endonuclease/exonuclease/phosphatase family metal-dependent hydrolase
VATLRILSWNIRTFGTYTPNAEDMRRIASIITNSQADIVCIQELMIGNGVIGQVGARISDQSLNIVRDLGTALGTADPNAGWSGAVSGVNSGISDHMRDAYAFVWKSKPANSANVHAQPVDTITNLGDVVILRQVGTDNFPGRRPGMLTLSVQAGTTVTPVNVISYHAPTPCNRFSKGIGSGVGINALASLPEVGGGLWSSNGHVWTYETDETDLPQIDTVVLGDFNFSMDQNQAASTYQNLLTNYQGCVSSPDSVVYTTYAPSGMDALRLVSAYDNLFVLKAHAQFAPALTFAQSGSIDFIADAAKQLGDAIGFLPNDLDLGKITAWYVIHQDQYKRQHAQRGLSDHIPVWADLTVAAGGATASHIQPTVSADNNSLLHAVFGTAVNGVYTDTTAAQRRTNLVTQLASYATNKAFPSGGNLGQIRPAVLLSMLAVFGSNPVVNTGLNLALANTGINPFTDQDFTNLYGLYLATITQGRPFAVSEAAVVALALNATINVNSIERGQYVTATINPGAQTTATIFRQALQFYRWA